MKKILVGILGIATSLSLLGCQQFENQIEKIEQPTYEKIEDVRALLDKLLEHIAELDRGLSFINGQLVDSELGVPLFETVSISEIPHFKDEDVSQGFVVRPVVDVDNPRLLIVAEGVNPEMAAKLDDALLKVRSDQRVQFRDSGVLVNYMIDMNKTVRQGNYLLYVTWEKSEAIMEVFEQHVR